MFVRSPRQFSRQFSRKTLRWSIDIARDDPVNPAISPRGLYIGRHGPWELENAHQRVTGQLVPNPFHL